MAWTAYTLGTVTGKNAVATAASIISEKLGEFVYDSSANTCSYTFKGVTYTVPATTSTSSSSNSCILSLNTDTGEFCVSQATALGSGAPIKDYVYAAVFLLQTDVGTEELAPLSQSSSAYKLATMFTTAMTNSTPAENKTNYFVMMPVCTNYLYSSDAKFNFKLVVNMFTTNNAAVTVGSIIQVGGQSFLCVAPTLFEKL